MIHELDSVVLTKDLPEHGLEAGDVGTVVLVHKDRAGFEVEFTTLTGETVAVITLPARIRAPNREARNSSCAPGCAWVVTGP